MSVLLELAIFPLDQGDSVSRFVAPVVKLIRDSGYEYRLTAMGTIFETQELPEGLALITEADRLLQEMGCDRVYATLKLDIRRGQDGRLQGKTASVEARIGEVDQ